MFNFSKSKWLQSLKRDWHFSLDREDAKAHDRVIIENIIKVIEWSTVAAAFLAAGEKLKSWPASLIGTAVVAMIASYLLSFTPAYWSATEHKLPGRAEARSRLIRILAFSIMFAALTSLINVTLKPLILTAIE